MIGLGLIAAGALSQATAAGASLSAILFLGAVGWFCALLAAILLIIFLIFLSIPVSGKPEKESHSSLSKGERTGLTIALIIIGAIGLAFLVSELN